MPLRLILALQGQSSGNVNGHKSVVERRIEASLPVRAIELEREAQSTTSEATLVSTALKILAAAAA